MPRTISQRELRNQSGEIMRGLERGESFVVTRNGIPLGELVPIKRRQFVPVDELKRMLAGMPRIDYQQFRRDVDEYLDQDPAPRV